jgi:hypothetical protein
MKIEYPKNEKAVTRLRDLPSGMSFQYPPEQALYIRGKRKAGQDDVFETTSLLTGEWCYAAGVNEVISVEAKVVVE